MAFSYKGGAGRSTALANIATALAKQGKKVLVIDYDMQAPGLHILFKAGRAPGGSEAARLKDAPSSPPGMPDYLLSDVTPADALERYVFDLAEICYDPMIREDFRRLEGAVHFLSGVASRPGQDFDAARAGDRFAELIDHLEDQAAFDYVCIDSPSGINARSEHVFDVSQLILIFYRWSTQHVEGTRIIMNYLNEYIKQDQLGVRTYQIVGNAVPRDEDLRRDAAEADVDLLIAYKRDVEDKLMKLLVEQYSIEQGLYDGTDFGRHRRSQLTKAKDDPRLEYVIAEDPMMKLREYLAVLRTPGTVYERIALDLVNKRLPFPEESTGVDD